MGSQRGERGIVGPGPTMQTDSTAEPPVAANAGASPLSSHAFHRVPSNSIAEIEQMFPCLLHFLM